MWGGEISSGEYSPGMSRQSFCILTYKYNSRYLNHESQVAQLRLFFFSSALFLNMASTESPARKSLDDSQVKTDKNDIWVENSQNEDPSDVMGIYFSYDTEYRHKVEIQLRRKIDTRILPLIVLIYLLNYLDRNSITQARLYGLQEDTGVKGAEYQTAISIFSAGYILMQLPSTLLMTKVRPSIFLVCDIGSSSLANSSKAKPDISLSPPAS